jgi:hypothetical protein
LRSGSLDLARLEVKLESIREDGAELVPLQLRLVT